MRVPAAEAVPLIRKIYERNGVGCCLHVALDDGNWDCLSWCLEQPDCCDECRACGELLLRMSVTARKKAARLAGI
jgi:hypothetical protein